MSLPLLAALTGALSAWLAYRRLSFYHDGLRPLARQPLRRDKAVQLCAPPTLRFGLPLSLATGVPLIHLLLLGTDAIGVALRTAPLVIAAGAAYGAAAIWLLQLALQFLSAQPGFTEAVQAVGIVAAAGYPLIPGLSLWTLSGPRWGGPVLLAGAAAVAGSLFGWFPADWQLPALVALLSFAILLALALRGKVLPASPPPPVINWRIADRLALAMNAGLLAALAQQSFLAGDPIGAALVGGQGDTVGAAAHGIVRTLSFLPTTVAGYWRGGAFAPFGTPDWLFAVGYLSPSAVTAIVAGGLALTAEIFLMPRLGAEVLRRPGVTLVAGHLRTAVSHVTDAVLVIGALAGAQAIWAYGGPLLVLAVTGGNEWARRPLSRAAAAAVALLLLAVAARLF